MPEHTLGIKLAVRVVHLHHSVETVLFEITGKVDVVIGIFLVFDLVDVCLYVSEETAVFVLFGVDRDAELCIPVRVPFVE